MRHILDKIETLKQETSNNAKVELLKEYLQDDEFRTVAALTMDETLHYNIKTLPIGGPKVTTPDFNLLVEFLYFLVEKGSANAEDKQRLASFAVDTNWEKVILMIINKDLKCGVAASLLNQAEPDFIHIMPYMRCSNSKLLKNIDYPAYAQLKEDGLFVNVFRNARKITYLSRNGNEFIFPEPSLEKEFQRYAPPHKDTKVYMGELRVKINEKWLPRKESNGIINKALKKNQTMTEKESLTVHFICWDVVPINDFWGNRCGIPYVDRFSEIAFLQDCGSDRIHLSETRIVENDKEAQDWAIELISEGEEGVIVKNYNTIWANNTSTVQIKLKAGDLGIGNERECELRVFDWDYGKKGTKYEDCLGKLICLSEDNELEVHVGSGFKDEDRGFLGFTEGRSPIIVKDVAQWIEDKYLNEIVGIRFNEVIKAKTSKRHSLFLPRYIEIRDKNEADTLQYIKDLQ